MQRPITGWGMGTFSYVSSSGHYYSHNNYIELLYSMGVLSIPVYYSIVYSKFKRIIVSKLSDSKMILCAVLLLEFLFSDLFAPNYYSIISSLSLAIVVSIINTEHKKELVYQTR